MTKEEIRVAIFVLCALLIGAFYRHWRTLNPPTPAPIPEQTKKWPKPPYVFKDRKEMEQRARASGEEFPPAVPDQEPR